VNEFDDDMRSKLLQFATGNSQVPVTGFKDLQGSDGPRHFKISYQSDERRLPISHTWLVSLYVYINEYTFKSYYFWIK